LVSELKWITRSHAMVDRIACPWLIRKFVDSQAEFIYVPASQVVAKAKELGAIPYDAKDVELGHHGEKCSFDAIIEKYELKDPALLEMARIVRGADTQAKDLTPESRGLAAFAKGFQMISATDHENIQKQFPMYDAIYAYCIWKTTSAK